MTPAKQRSMSAHVAIYAVGNLGQRLIGFIMLPIYTRKLTPEDYGIYELLSITTGILGIMLGVGIRSAVIRFYHRYDIFVEFTDAVQEIEIILEDEHGTVIEGEITTNPNETKVTFDPFGDGFVIRTVASNRAIHRQPDAQPRQIVIAAVPGGGMDES